MLIKHARIPVKKVIFIGLLPSFLKIAYYRSRGYTIGKKVKIGLGSVVSCKEATIGDNCKISFGVIITVDKLKMGRNVRIGTGTIIDTREVHLDDDSIIGELVGVGGIKNEHSLLKVGKRAHIFQYSLINPTLPIILGDDSSFGYSNYVFTHASWKSSLEGYPVVFAPITIGKGVWLPSRVQIFPNVTIGDNAVIGAGSIVTKDIPANSLAVGSPAKVVEKNYPPEISTEEKEEKLKEIFDSFENYMEYHGFQVERRVDGSAQEIIVNRKNKSYAVKYLPFVHSDIKPDKNSLLIFNSDEDLRAFTKTEDGMLINLKTKKRIGSTDIGEEFARFVSRYGIRFDRLD
jgi:acetyltransferase-like isoleucine patch superfamily enzyme